MTLRIWMTTVVRSLAGLRALHFYSALLALLPLFAVGVRTRTALLTQRIHAALSQLEQVRVDQTTEAQLLKALPALVKRSEKGALRTYSMEISNWPHHEWVFDPFIPQFSWYSPQGCVKPTSRKIPFWLGHRYVLFRSVFVISDGRVSSTSYALALEGGECPVRISADSIHGRWVKRLPVPVSSLVDQSPAFEVSGDGESLHVTYAFDAPAKLVSHALRLELSCMWSMKGCRSVREVAAALLQDKASIEAATLSRLSSGNPCPDEMLAGRVRYLPGLNVELLEVTNSRSDVIGNYEGDFVSDYITVTDYRLIEVIRGVAGKSISAMTHRNLIPAPLSVTQQIWNPVRPAKKRGERVLYFSGAKFDSCRAVPATPSALSAVRSAVPAPKRSEDEMSSKSITG